MDNSDDKLTSQFCIQMIPPTLQSHQSFANISEDIHICGACKQSFNDIHQFLQHKSECNIILNTDSELFDTQINYIISDQSLFRISGLTLDSSTLPIYIQSDDSTEKLDVLQTNLITTNDQTSSKKDIQIDEEVVASFLANQLSKEVLNSTPIEANKDTDVESSKNESQVIQLETLNTCAENVTEVEVVKGEDNEALSSRKVKAACNVCNFVPQYPRDLIRHMRRHTGEKPYECTFCSRKFSRHDKLQSHKRIHTGEKPYRCQICSYSTTESGPLRKHLRIHTDERPYKCQMCPYKARDSSQLTVHLRTHTGDSPFICQVETCGRAFKTSTDLKRHGSVHNRNNSQTAKTTSKVKEAQEKAAVEEPGFYFPCALFSCDFIGTSLRNLRAHSKIHHNVSNNSDANNDKNKTNKTYPFACHLCSSNYKHKSKLLSHLKKHKLVPATRPMCTKSHQCHLCNVAFVRSDSLRSHLRQHQQNDQGKTETFIVTSDNQIFDVMDGQSDFELVNYSCSTTNEPSGPGPPSLSKL